MFKHYQDMALFAALMDVGSFTKLASQLDMPKSRVSQRIHSLEESIGVRLLNRTTRRVSLTSAGEKYYLYCKEMLEIGINADSFIQSITARPAGKLRIVAPAGLMVSSLTKINHDFLKIYRDVKIEMLTADSFYESVEGAFDVAFRIGQPVEQSYIGRLVGDYERLLVASTDYLKDKTISHPLHLHEHDIYVHKTWKKLTLCNTKEEFIFQEEPRQLTDNLLYLLQSTLQGFGISILPKYLINEYIESGRLSVLLPDWHVNNIDIWLIYSSSKNNSPILKSYVNFVLTSDLTKPT